MGFPHYYMLQPIDFCWFQNWSETFPNLYLKLHYTVPRHVPKSFLLILKFNGVTTFLCVTPMLYHFNTHIRKSSVVYKQKEENSYKYT